VFHRPVLAVRNSDITALAGLWFFVCLIGGVVLLILAGRAIGAALLGAVVGAVFGAFNAASGVVPIPESFPPSLSKGASIGLVLGGLIGLLLPESLPASVLRKMGIGIAILGSVSLLAIDFADLAPWVFGSMEHVLYAFDVLFLVVLCFVSVERARRRGVSEDVDWHSIFGRLH
jgi:hypothetical protein